ncbi:MAG: pseudouridine synthase, partial [bacterium]
GPPPAPARRPAGAAGQGRLRGRRGRGLSGDRCRPGRRPDPARRAAAAAATPAGRKSGGQPGPVRHRPGPGPAHRPARAAGGPHGGGPAGPLGPGTRRSRAGA